MFEEIKQCFLYCILISESSFVRVMLVGYNVAQVGGVAPGPLVIHSSGKIIMLLFMFQGVLERH